MLSLPLSLVLDQFGTVDNLRGAVTAAARAIADHARTIDVPAPRFDPPLLDTIMASGGEYELVDDQPPAPTPPDPWQVLRGRRDQALRASDWSQLPDAPLSAAQRAAWSAYRQALRDLPANTTDPTAPAWPTAPTAAQGGFSIPENNH